MYSFTVLQCINDIHRLIYNYIEDDSLPVDIRIVDHRISTEEHDYMIDTDDTLSDDVSSMEEDDDSDDSLSSFIDDTGRYGRIDISCTDDSEDTE